MNKRVVSILTTALLLIGLFCVETFASDAASIQGSSCKVKPGGEIKYEVSISGNQGLMAYMIYVECDTNVFSVEYDESEEKYCVSNGESFQSGSILCNKYGSTGWKIVWYASAPISEDGVLFSLPIHTRADANAGEYPVKISYSVKNTLDGNYQPVQLNCSSGTIEVLPTEAAFSIDAICAVPGSDVNMTVTIDANPGIAAFLVYIDCDPGVFAAEYNETSQDYTVCQGSFASGGTIICNKNGTSGYKVLWYNTTESVNTGSAFTLPVTISENAPCGDYEIGVRVSQANVTNENGTIVPAEATGCTFSLVPFQICSAEYIVFEETDQVELSVTAINGYDQQACLICALYSEGKMLDAAVLNMDSGERLDSSKVTLHTNGINSGLTIKLFALDRTQYVPIISYQTLDTIIK